MDTADSKENEGDFEARYIAQYKVLMTWAHRKMTESSDQGGKSNKMDVGNVNYGDQGIGSQGQEQGRTNEWDWNGMMLMKGKGKGMGFKGGGPKGFPKGLGKGKWKGQEKQEPEGLLLQAECHEQQQCSRSFVLVGP